MQTRSLHQQVALNCHQPLSCCHLQVPILADLVDLPFVSSILQGFLPSLVLLIFLAVAPYLLKALIQRAGLASMTAVDAQLIGMYFLFQLFAVFIFSFISGTALSQLQGLIDDPHKWVMLQGFLCTALPSRR